MFTVNRKRAATLGALAVIAVGTAFAFWTMGGSGTGSASAQNPTTNLVVNQTTTGRDVSGRQRPDDQR